ncbi:hypothetical protein F8388_017457 [Cannabis sativa]|uniref:Uncharacterized protein n=1 Tax=Cannabis sativa TaxID=3483 RepID=A0A7J6DPQ4_CANSA|nr:hypothetical protein F8388_017457 [Cannabis sativa]
MMLSDSPLLISLHNRVRETKTSFSPLDQGTQSPGGGAVASSSKTHKMPEGFHLERPLFAGALTSTFPQRFQEVFVDPSRMKEEVVMMEVLHGFFKTLPLNKNLKAAWLSLRDGKVGKHKMCEGICCKCSSKEVNTDILISAYEPIHIK